MSEKRKTIRYNDAGVDISAGNLFAKKIGALAAITMRPEVLSGIGGFSGGFRLPARDWQSPILMSSTDGVGTKLEVANLAGRHDTIGIDLVAMCVNDLVVNGAEPLVFLDYLACGRLDSIEGPTILAGIAEGCRQAGAALIGGETAEMPGLYAEGVYDLAGFCIGVVEEANIIDGARVRPGDAIIGLGSSGIHSNGYSLVRKIIFEKLGLRIDSELPGVGRTVADELLAPTRIYVQTMLALIQQFDVRAVAHITGGGLVENMPRTLPKGVSARLDDESWETPAIFEFLRDEGPVEDSEMWRTFNMGIGMTLVVPAEELDAALSLCREMGEIPYAIGEIVEDTEGPQVHITEQ